MNPTLREIIQELINTTLTVEQLRARIAELEAERELLRVQLNIDSGLPPGWRLVRVKEA